MRRQLLQIWFLAGLVLVVCAARRAPETLYDSAAALETFDRAWTIIHETHFDTEFNGVDWPAVRDELRPRAEEAGSVEELRRVIREMISRLGQSHFALIPGRLAEQDPLLSPAGDGDSAPGGDGQVGIDLRLVDDRFVVRSVEPGQAADQAGVRPGWIVVTIGDREIDDWKSSYGEVDDGPAGRYLATESALARLSGSPGSSVELEFVDGSNTRVSAKLKREPPVGQRVQFANLPPFFARLWSDELQPTDLGIEVGLIRMNIWMPALSQPFAEAVNSFREADGMIIDLRGNPGGVGAMVMGIAGHFLDEPVALGTLAMRNQKLEYRANPRRVNPAGERVKPFDGPGGHPDRRVVGEYVGVVRRRHAGYRPGPHLRHAFGRDGAAGRDRAAAQPGHPVPRDRRSDHVVGDAHRAQRRRARRRDSAGPRRSARRT